MLVFLNGISEMSVLADKLKEHAEQSKKWSESQSVIWASEAVCVFSHTHATQQSLG